MGVVNTGRPLQVKYWGRDPCGVDAYVHTRTSAADATSALTLSLTRLATLVIRQHTGHQRRRIINHTPCAPLHISGPIYKISYDNLTTILR